MVERHPFLCGSNFVAFAHRGGTTSHPENTIEAFQAAIDLGFDHLETDVHASLDGELYAFHDDDLARVVGVPARISELSSADVDQLRFGGYRVPRFDEVLTTWPTAMINVDPKADAAVVPLVRTLRRHGAVTRVCVGSFSDRRIAWCRRELGPELCTSMGPRELTRLVIASRGVPVAPPSAACVQVPTSWPLFGQRTIDFTDRSFIDHAHDVGLDVHVWTINDAPTMHALVDAGVDGIMTDEPALLRSVLIERGRWPHALV